MTKAQADPYLVGAGCSPEVGVHVALSIDTLKSERDGLKAQLREIEAEQRRVEAELKGVRQRELQTKREIEALTTLIEIAESRDEPND